jgi:hypothetical protein
MSSPGTKIKRRTVGRTVGCLGAALTIVLAATCGSTGHRLGAPEQRTEGSAFSPPVRTWTSGRTQRLEVRHTRRQRWELAVPPAGRHIRIEVAAGQCAGFRTGRISRVLVRQTRSAVFVGAVVSTASPSRRARAFHMGCYSSTAFISQTVRLRRPLGGRALFDTISSPPRLRWPTPLGSEDRPSRSS